MVRCSEICNIAGSLLFTGIFASLSGINIFASAEGIVITLIASLLPDIDHPKSILGRAVKPLSRWINRHYGHRTITHSAFVLVLSTLIFSLFEKVIAGKTSLSTIFFYSYLSHLLFDMMTLQGIPLLYPFFKNPFVLPANPAFRIRTGDIKAETIIFCTFILLSISLRPLFQNGFWTSYNRLFGTMKHLSAEFHRSETLLEVKYFARKGSETLHGKGYCIEVSSSGTVLLENSQFTILDEKELIIEKVIPKSTNLQFFFEDIHISNISIDSINTLIKQITSPSPIYDLPTYDFRLQNNSLLPVQNYLYEINLYTNQKLQLTLNGTTTETKSIKAKYINSIHLSPPFKEGWSKTGEVPYNSGEVPYKPNPRIPILQTKLRQLKAKNQQLNNDWQAHLNQLNQLKNLINQETHLPNKEHLFHKYQQAMKVKAPIINFEQEILLTTEIQQLRHQEYLTNKQKQLQSTLTHPPLILISGTITLLKIRNADFL